MMDGQLFTLSVGKVGRTPARRCYGAITTVSNIAASSQHLLFNCKDGIDGSDIDTNSFCGYVLHWTRERP